MQYRRLGQTGISISCISFGAGPVSTLMVGRDRDASRVHVATKVRLTPTDLLESRGAVRRSVEASLQRLKLSRITLLQLHNSITRQRGDEPTSITPQDVLGKGGIAEVFQELQTEGICLHLGLTGIGQPLALAEVVRSGQFATMQVPYHLLNPSAGRVMEPDFSETNYGNIIAECCRCTSVIGNEPPNWPRASTVVDFRRKPSALH
jgi:aryl-alcohol dehydrogenase-like predicted oxidoreductase